MIIVYRFQTHCCCGCCCDGSNVFGHAAVSFNNAGFAISYFGSPGGGINADPTYADEGHPLKALSSGIEGWKVKKSQSSDKTWQEKLVDRSNAKEFKHLISKAYIISNEDLQKHGKDLSKAPGGGVSEDKAHAWWKRTLENRNFGGADCADMVFRGLIAAGCSNVGWRRTLSRPLYTPEAAIEFANAVNAKIVSAMELKGDSIKTIEADDRSWALASGHVSKEEDVASQSAKDDSKSSLLKKGEQRSDLVEV
jgi:hypothetical protein